MPIASYFIEKPFTNHNFTLKSDNILYLFSDGYFDQIGGIYGKKFLRSQFDKLLLYNSYKPMQEQKKALEKQFHEWKRNYKQVDDIMILGIKIQ
jgi:serine phosphatase RsbU (regulator of sigma subunit)